MPRLATSLGSRTSRWQDFRAAAEEAAVVQPPRWLERGRRSDLSWLRRHRPLLTLGRFAVVTRRRDVLRVLADPESYPPPYTRRLPGPFILGLTGAEFDRQRRELSAVL